MKNFPATFKVLPTIYSIYDLHFLLLYLYYESRTFLPHCFRKYGEKYLWDLNDTMRALPVTIKSD